MPNTKGFDTPFTDYAAPKPSGGVCPTLGTLSSRQVNSSDANVTHSDATKQAQYDDLHYATPDQTQPQATATIDSDD